MSEEQNDWEKEREEREFKRWRWETARKFVIADLQRWNRGGSSIQIGLDECANHAVRLTDALIAELKKE